jgi:hypothetical protein
MFKTGSQPFKIWGHIHPFLSTHVPLGYKSGKFIKNATHSLLQTGSYITQFF